ncbi:MAG: lipid-transfer protein [Chloroflexi bacterium]|nr:lipid-transfer protein [Chloroflexota bacterium]
MQHGLSKKAAIVGIGETDYSRESGRSELTLALQAITAAIRDAGLTPKDIDGLLKFQVDTVTEGEIASCLGMDHLRFYGELGGAGTAGCGLVAHAAAAVALGLANNVVVYRAMNGRSGRRYGRGDVTMRGGVGPAAFTEPFGQLVPQQALAMLARRHMHEYGTTSRQFGAVAVAFRAHANRNPKAVFHDTPLTLEDHQNSRYVVEPFRLFDCCLETDGGCAVVVTSAERARDLPQPPAFILAAGQCLPGYRGPLPSLTESNARILAPELFAAAGVTPADIDVAQIYDHFSALVLFALEDYGFCKKGEGGPFVEAGNIQWPNGSLPVNTAGGHLSEAYLHVMNHVNEAVRQLRGTSTAQVQHAELVLVDSGIGAGALILGK